MVNYFVVAASARSTRSAGSDRVAAINRIFGLSPTGADIDILHPTRMPDRGLTVIVGLSGSGKTTLLNELRARFDDIAELPAIVDEQTPLIDLFDTDVKTGIRWLGKFGLGEAKLMTTPYRYLSDGQKVRARMALAMWARPKRVIIDEFLSVLDRLTAKVVAYNFQRLCREFGTNAYVATAHDDLIESLAPDHVVRLDLNAAQSETTRVEAPRPTTPVIDEIEVTEGTREDYWALSKFHYIEHLSAEAPLTSDDWQHSIRQIRVARYQGRAVGVLLCSLPLPDVFEGHAYFDIINRSAIVVLRVIIHPAFRGIGLTKLIQPVINDDTVCVVACSALGRFFPFFLGAGFQRCEYPRNIRYPEHDALEALIRKSGLKDEALLNRYQSAQAFYEQLPDGLREELREITTEIVIKSNVDYCLFFDKLIGMTRNPEANRQGLTALFADIVARHPHEAFGVLISESLYFPVQGFVKAIRLLGPRQPAS